MKVNSGLHALAVSSPVPTETLCGIRAGLDTGHSCASTYKFILCFASLHQVCLM
jgi:hypothetical protein